jgi:malonate decarboxylase beta subunit
METIWELQNKVPYIALTGSTIGAYGAQGFVCLSADVVIANDFGRIGLTGPEVIQQEVGKDEFDASDRALIWRTMGARSKYILGDVDYLIKDTIGTFRDTIANMVDEPMSKISKTRKVGSPQLVEENLEVVKLAAEKQIKDSKDIWKIYGNENVDEIPEMPQDKFLSVVKRRPRRI